MCALFVNAGGNMSDELLELIYDCIAADDMHPFYVRSEWQRKRVHIFQRDHGECQSCKRKHKLKLVKLNAKDRNQRAYIHHIKHLRDYPELAMSDDNLETLCFTCHEEEHIEERQRFEVRKERFTNEEKW